MPNKIRTLSKTVQALSQQFPILLVTGPRQVGKTTLLESCADKTRNYVTLDDLDQRALAQQDPALFLQAHPSPLIIDEIQYAPQLFSALKMKVDQTKELGQFWLTGSQKFHLMQGVSETLAGRVGILDLLGFSQAELCDRADESQPFLPSVEWIEQARSRSPKVMDLSEVFSYIWRGSFPALATGDKHRDVFYNSYIQTYIQRDVRALTRVGDEMAFTRCLRAVAARTGQLLNYADLARDVDVDQKTVKSWVSILETSGLVYLLYPYHNNITKRHIKTPKIYFLDTGLCSYLTQWSSWQSLEAGAMSGAILETYMLAEILKSYWHNSKTPLLYFYRDRDQKEIDLLVDQDGCLYPIEFKKSATPSLAGAKNFEVLDRLGRNIGPGAILCLKETYVPLSRTVAAIPISYL